MTSDRFRQAINEINNMNGDKGGMSQARLAELLGIDKGTVNRWATGVAQVPRLATIIVELLASGTLSVKQLTSLHNRKP